MYIQSQHMAVMLNQANCSYNAETKTLKVPYWGKEFLGHDIVITKTDAILEKDGKKVDDVDFDYSNEKLIDEIHACNS